MQCDQNKDIGYFVKNYVKYTIRSFKINDFAFSDGKYKEFCQSLKKNGLEPVWYHPLGFAFPTEQEVKAEVKAWKNRTPLYQ